MTVRSIKQRFSERRLSIRRSDPDISSPDESIHRSKTTTTASAARRLYRRKSSMLSSFPSNTSNDIILPTTIDPETQALAIRAAEEKKNTFRESLPESLLLDHDARDCVAPFQREEIVFGPKLGAGEFSNVFEVSSFKYQPNFAEDATLTIEELDRRLHMKRYEKYRETEKARYALKHIKPEYYGDNDDESYVQAASDLALEAEFLASLQHPNIIKLRGISHGGAAGFEQGPGGYFLVIDRLFETLDQRMSRWRRTGRQSRLMSSINRSITTLPVISSLGKPLPSSLSPKVKENEVMDERLHIAFQISSALKYLHSHSIMFRDLKPANIGFDVRGDVKIFDFGLARIMPESGDGNLDVYEMSGAGSPRYMAPECLSDCAYNMKADVYSFSIVLWEILSGKTPYSFIRKVCQLVQQVVDENFRPAIDYSWPAAVQGMMESSFDSVIDKRPKMESWYNVIRETLVTLRGGDRISLNESWVVRRRSFESMNNITKGL